MRSKCESMFVLAALAGVVVIVVALAMSFFMAYSVWLKWLAYGGMASVFVGCIGLMFAQLLSDMPKATPKVADASKPATPDATAAAGPTVGATAGALAASGGIAAVASTDAPTTDDLFGGAELPPTGDDPFANDLGDLENL